MSAGASHREGKAPTAAAGHPLAVGQPLGEFLASAQVMVLDVLRGAAPGTRRLLLGATADRAAVYAVAVADGPASAPAVDGEGRLLGDLGAQLSADMLRTVPRRLGPVTVGGRAAVVLDAAPGLVPERRRGPRVPQRRLLDAVLGWLTRLWRETSAPTSAVELGAAAADELLSRYVGSAQLAPTLAAVHGARLRLAGHQVRRTVTHGCLCPRHVIVADGVVVGVDDWGLGAVGTGPLRDLGGFAVHCAGVRLPELVAGRTAYAHLLRDFVVSGLVTLDLPPACWRDVLLLTQLEHAISDLEHRRVGGMDLLATTVRAMPRQRRYDGKRTR